ncbi:cytochrome-c peroxidase [Chitinophaga pendula]|nr:cytochrome-c peroxidase [Chitinophaga sp. MD30]UCJ10362.1 cytochrome-c peroxidase [Chitinophaga pendula]
MNKYGFIFCCMLSITACSKSDKNDTPPPFEGFRQPANFAAAAYRLSDNNITQAGFELGRKLFYEPRFSRNNTISCGDCHLQAAAFTHHGHDVSHGIDDRLGTRNATPLMNLAWHTTFMWDGGVFDLDLQPIAPITNEVEMDEKVDNVVKKLQASSEYPALFQKAFGNRDITAARMLKALSQFMVMLVSSNAKYDKVMRKEGDVFTAEEQKGYTLYQQKCSTCHQEPLFTDQSFRNNGLSIGPNNDEGRYLITLNPQDKYKFKVPSLRNLAYTAPYMHDGRLLTLNGVLDHYTQEVQRTPNLDPLLQQQALPGISLSAEERTQLLAFLNTLNDRDFITDKRFSQP